MKNLRFEHIFCVWSPLEDNLDLKIAYYLLDSKYAFWAGFRHYYKYIVLLYCCCRQLEKNVPISKWYFKVSSKIKNNTQSNNVSAYPAATNWFEMKGGCLRVLWK